MTPQTGLLDRAVARETSEELSLTSLHEAARELERAGDWPGALMAYEGVLVRTENTGREPDPKLLIKLGDLLVKTDSPRLAIRMFERAATAFAAAGTYKSVIALCIKIVRTDRERTDVYVRFAKLLLERGYIDESRLVLVDYAERAWARRTLRTLKQIAEAPTDEALRRLRRLIHAVEATFATSEFTGKVVTYAPRTPTVSDGAVETERPEAPHDRAAFEAIRPRHRGPFSTLPTVPLTREDTVGPSSVWPRAAALPAGEPVAMLSPERALPPIGPSPARRPDPIAWVRRVMAAAHHVAQGLGRLKPPSWVAAPIARRVLVVLGAGTAAYLLGPLAYSQLGTYLERGGAHSADSMPAIIAAQDTDVMPTYSAGGFLAVQDTAIVPLRWDPNVIVIPAGTPEPAEDDGNTVRGQLTTQPDQ